MRLLGDRLADLFTIFKNELKNYKHRRYTMIARNRIIMAIIAIALMSCSAAKAQDTALSTVRTESGTVTGMLHSPAQNPVVEVVRKVREAIVQIKVEAQVPVQNLRNPFFDDDVFRFFFPQPPAQQQRPITSMGSGFIYDFNPATREAYILTNNHVVEKGREGTITVTMADKASYKGTVVGLDPNTDVAVIKIIVTEGEKITVAPLGDSAKLEIGEWAIAIGNPFGESGLDRTVTLGVISAIGRSNLNFGSGSPIYQDYIQTDAAINPGNSGGPLLNIHGEVIGINSAITSTSGGNIGIGFAIPINLAHRVVEDLVAGGKVSRAYIGILPQEITSDLKEAFDLKEIAGVLVAKVELDSPADKAGIKVGDVILEFNHEKVPNVSKFRIAVATSKVGSDVPVRLVRDHKEQVLKIKLEGFPDEIAAAGTDKPVNGKVSAGITVEAIDSATGKKLGVSGDEGVVVTKIDANSPAAKTGIQAGFIILSINAVKVNSPAEFSSVLSNAIDQMNKSDRKIITLYVADRNKNHQFIPLRFD